MVMSAMVRIFSLGERLKCSFQRGEAKLNRTFHISPYENICTNIHYLFYMTSKNNCYHLERLNNIHLL